MAYAFLFQNHSSCLIKMPLLLKAMAFLYHYFKENLYDKIRPLFIALR